MKFDAVVLSYSLNDIADLTRAAENIGFDGFWLGETNTDPLLSCALVAEHSQQMTIGTGIAVAFARSPATLAYIAWDLARYSRGRFVLGLGPQVRAHNERRFGIKWEKPVLKMRETILAVRAFWECWQNGTALKFEGEFFNLNLMTPFFSPSPHDYPKIPVYLAAVNEQMLQLVGEVCDGGFIHAIHTVPYLEQFAIPHIKAGLVKSGRSREDVTLATSVFVIPTDDPEYAAKAEAHVRQQLSFYLSTPAYQVVMELHGWKDIGLQLSKLARQGEWETMANTLTDDMMETMVIRGTWAELPTKIQAKYGSLIDRVSYYLPFIPGEIDAGWQATIGGFKHG